MWSFVFLFFPLLLMFVLSPLASSVFTASELETLVTGNPDMDVQLLRDKTEYRGNVSAFDKHVLFFWEALEEMTQEQRKNFLQFVWGRNRSEQGSTGMGETTRAVLRWVRRRACFSCAHLFFVSI